MRKGNKSIWMRALCVAIIFSAIGYMCLSFNIARTDITDGEYAENSEENEEWIEAGKKSKAGLDDSQQIGKRSHRFSPEIWFQVDSFVEEQLPELDDIGYYIQHKTEGKASLIVEAGSHLIELYDNNNNFMGYYYGVYVGEQWEDHQANWYWFYVSDELDEILWNEIVNDEVYTLEEWRNSSLYKEQMNRLREFREMQENET